MIAVENDYAEVTVLNIKEGESGNALFLILIAVALFAALSYAVTQSGRGSGSIDREQALISSAQLTQFPTAVRNTVTRMILTGTAVDDVDYMNTNASDVNIVFGPDGGGITVQSPPSGAVSGVSAADADDAGPVWRFKAVPDDGLGFYISGIGTANGLESFAFIGLSRNTCLAVNNGLGLNPTEPPEEGASVLNTTTDPREGWPVPTARTGGSAADENATSTIGKGVLAAVGSVQAFACIANSADSSSGPWIYYHAMIEQ